MVLLRNPTPHHLPRQIRAPSARRDLPTHWSLFCATRSSCQVPAPLSRSKPPHPLALTASPAIAPPRPDGSAKAQRASWPRQAEPAPPLGPSPRELQKRSKCEDSADYVMFGYFTDSFFFQAGSQVQVMR